MNPINFFQSLYDRWIAETPKHALLVSKIMAVCTVIMGLPAAIAMMGWQVPHVVSPYFEGLVACATALLGVILKLQRKPQS